MYGNSFDSFEISSTFDPINRLTEKKVLPGFITACRFAICPTNNSCFSVYATIEGVVLNPSAFVITLGFPPSIAATTEFVYYPNSKKVAVQYLGGENLPDWAWNYLTTVEAWAKDNKCDGIECTARFGMWKWLGKSGWEKSYTIFEKRFNNG